MRHRFTLRRIAVAAIGILAVAAVLWCYVVLSSVMPTTTPITATILAVLTVLACFCIYRAVTRWKAIGTWRRTYAVITAGASSAL